MKKYLYLFLLVLSSLIMSAEGFAQMRRTGEKYTDHPALVAIAINNIEKTLFPEEEESGMIDIASLTGGSDKTSDLATGLYEEGDGGDSMEASDGKTVGDDTEDDRAGQEDEVSAEEKKDIEQDSAGKDSDKKSKKKKKKKKKDKDSDGDKALEDADETGDGDGEKEDSDDDTEEKDASANKKKRIKWKTVDESYFDDAVFIGDSRQQGFGLYSGLDNAQVYAVKSYTVFATATKPLVDTPFGKVTLVDALALNQHRFKKVYIMFGINEIASNNKDWAERYYNLVDYIKLMEPGAVIYIESIMHVSASTAAKRPSLSNEKVEEKNAILRQLAQDEGAVYLDLNEAVTDENGYLPSDAASDGIHLKASYIQVLKEYIMKHAVMPKLKKVKKDDDDDGTLRDEYGFTYIDLTPAQQLLKDQLDVYYAQQGAAVQ